MDKIIASLLAEGMTYEDIINKVMEAQKEDEAKAAAAAKEQAIAEARRKVVEAAVNYAYALEVVTEEEIEALDVEQLEKEFIAMEKNLNMLKNMFTSTPTPKRKKAVQAYDMTEEEMDAMLSTFLKSLN